MGVGVGADVDASVGAAVSSGAGVGVDADVGASMGVDASSGAGVGKDVREHRARGREPSSRNESRERVNKINFLKRCRHGRRRKRRRRRIVGRVWASASALMSAQAWVSAHHRSEESMRVTERYGIRAG